MASAGAMRLAQPREAHDVDEHHRRLLRPVEAGRPVAGGQPLDHGRREIARRDWRAGARGGAGGAARRPAAAPPPRGRPGRPRQLGASAASQTFASDECEPARTPAQPASSMAALPQRDQRASGGPQAAPRPAPSARTARRVHRARRRRCAAATRPVQDVVDGGGEELAAGQPARERRREPVAGTGGRGAQHHDAPGAARRRRSPRPAASASE